MPAKHSSDNKYVFPNRFLGYPVRLLIPELTMWLLILGLILFFAIHLVPVIGGLRQSFIDRVGEPIYKSVFALISAVGFVLMLMGKGKAEYVAVFDPPMWSGPLAKIAMLPAFILLVASYYPNNIKRIVGHPMLIGVVLWSATHLFANGDQASVLLFGSFLIYCIVDLLSSIWRPQNIHGTTSLINDLIVVAVGTTLYFLIFKIHGAVFAPIA